ncbi:MAG TPA: MIP/aquaporin family protein [bacterium]|nr:MIP/aquaporin family protein [bacterium]
MTPAHLVVTPPLARRALAEFLGTALLLAAIVGSGVAAQRLSPRDVGLQLLENSTATAAALVAIILAVGPVSGAHLNPAVTLADGLLGGATWRDGAAYAVAQVSGGAVGTIVANLSFSLPPVALSVKPRWGVGVWIGEALATFGLVLVVFGVTRSRRAAVAPFAVGAYIAGAYWFTSSTSFANPAVTLARTLSDTFAGIAPASVPPFLGAEAVACVLAVGAIRVLYPGVGGTERLERGD